jgi:pimeloyl-ACP methyl ester carboxylesterase
VLLLHGFGDNALVWHHFASGLADACSSLAIDLRGHGHSEWDPKGTYPIDDFVADAVSVLDELCPVPVVLVGHSLGAQIAIHAANARRERTSAVVLVDGSLKSNPLSWGHVRRKFRERGRVHDSPEQYVAFMREQLPLARKALLDVLAEGALRVNQDGLCEERCDPMLVNRDDLIDEPAVMAALRQITRPILFVRGEGSSVFSRATARELLAALPQSRMTSVPIAGHTVMLDNPEGFSSTVKPYVLKFLSGLFGEAAAASSRNTNSGLAPESSNQGETL